MIEERQLFAKLVADQVAVYVDPAAAGRPLSGGLGRLIRTICGETHGRRADLVRTVRGVRGVFRARVFVLPEGTRGLIVVDEADRQTLATSGETRSRTGASRRRALPSGVSLSARQWQIVRELRLGRSNAEIGEALGISPVTVGAHLTKIYRAFCVKGRAAFLAMLGRSRVPPSCDGPRPS